MPVLTQKAKLVYFDVPKVACTTIKSFFWYLDTGKQITKPKGITRWIRKLLNQTGIHDREGYQTLSFVRAGDIPAGFDTVTVVRDPIFRFHSAWKNKANQEIFTRRRESRDLWLEDVPTNPSFGEYIDYFSTYRMVSRAVRMHTYPYSWHLGPQLDAFNHVFELENLAEFQAFLSKRLGYEVTFPKQNTASLAGRDSTLTTAQRDKLRTITSQDYEWLGDRYSFDRSYERFEARMKSAISIGSKNRIQVAPSN
ncbi:MAG: sulfotransferase family 2 domain-containing protein [Cyanobacteria bacterium P01_G01_bin.4]